MTSSRLPDEILIIRAGDVRDADPATEGGDRMSYRVTIVDDHDTVLDVITIDGYDLTKPLAQQWLGDEIASGMGSRHVAECASRQAPGEG